MQYVINIKVIDILPGDHIDPVIPVRIKAVHIFKLFALTWGEFRKIIEYDLRGLQVACI